MSAQKGNVEFADMDDSPDHTQSAGTDLDGERPFTYRYLRMCVQSKSDLAQLQSDVHEMQLILDKLLQKPKKQATVSMNVDAVKHKDFQVVVDSLQKQINNASNKSSVVLELDKRLSAKIDELSAAVAAQIERKHGSKIEQIKKTNMFIVDELLNLDNQQRINYKNFMTKLKQIDDLRQTTSLEKKLNTKIHSDPFIYKGGVPEINCLSCDQNIPVLKIEQMLDEQSARKVSPENSGRVFPKRGTNVKNKKMHYMMEESTANKKESAQKIFDNYMNFEKEAQMVDQLKRKSLETGDQNLLSMTTGSAMFK